MTQDVLHLLTPDERAFRAALEDQVMVAMHATIIGARALRELRDKRLYRDTYGTFEEYALKRFKLTRQRLYQLIEFADVGDAAFGQGIILDNERIARALSTTAPEDYALVLEAATVLTGKAKLSSADVKAVATVFRDLAHGHVEHPDTGQPVPFASIPAAQQPAVLGKALRKSAADRTQLQGTEEVRPLDWIAELQVSGLHGALRFDAAGYMFELTDPVTGEVRAGPVRPSLWDAIRHARAAFEESPVHEPFRGPPPEDA